MGNTAKLLILTLFSLSVVNQGFSQKVAENSQGELEQNIRYLIDNNLSIEKRWKAEEAIVNIGKSAVIPLIKLLENIKEKDAINLGIYALKEIGDIRAIPALGQILLKNKDEDLRVNAALALGDFRDKIAGEYLLQWLTLDENTQQNDSTIIRYYAHDYMNSSTLKSNYNLTGNISSGWNNVGNQIETIIKNAYLEFSFVGTGCDMIDYRDISGALFVISIDNKMTFEYEQFSDVTKENRINLCKNLPYGKHVIKIQNTGENKYHKGDIYMRVKGFDVYKSKIYEVVDSQISRNAFYDKFIKGAVIVSLGKLQYRKAVPILIKKLEEDPLYIRRLAAWSLGSIKDDSAVPALLNALLNKDEDKAVRYASIKALQKIGDIKIIPVLEELLKNEENLDIKNAVNKALSQLVIQSPEVKDNYND